MAKKTGKEQYIVTGRISSQSGDEVWLPGSEIFFDDPEVARKHLEKGTVIRGDKTPPLEPKPSPIKIHEANGGNNGATNSATADG